MPSQVCAGLLLLFLGYRAFHRRAAERADALQQLRAAKAGLAGGAGGITGGGSGLGGIGRRGGLIEISGLERPGGSGGAHLDALQQADGAAQEDGLRAGSAGTDGGAALAAATGSGQAPPELLRFCEEHFGLEWVRRWGAAAQQVCSATRQLVADAGAAVGSSGASTVTCRRISDTHLPPKSAPHVLCDATNLRLEPAKLVRGAVNSGCSSPTCDVRGRLDACSGPNPQAIMKSPNLFLLLGPLSHPSAAPRTVPSAPSRLPVPVAHLSPLSEGRLGGQLLVAGLPAGGL